MDKKQNASFYVAPVVEIRLLSNTDVITNSGNTYFKFGWTGTEDNFNDYDFE